MKKEKISPVPPDQRFSTKLFLHMTKIKNNPTKTAFLLLPAIAVAALTAVFFVAAGNFALIVKIAVFAAGITALIVPAFYFFKFQNNFPQSEAKSGEFDAEIIEKLIILEEAAEFFGASLKPAEMFRLVAGRVGELLEFDAAILFLPENQEKQLKIAYVEGESLGLLKNKVVALNSGLAGKVYLSRRIRAEAEIISDRKVLPSAALGFLHSTIAAPLFKGEQVFAVLQLFGTSDFDEGQINLLEAVTARIAPLMQSSLIYERNLSNALTDALTNLPNERAFYLVLENQIAEAQRLPVKQNLSILTADIRGFSALNQKYGHAGGDRILTFAADLIKKQLRQMDFLARTTGDEFYAVLPTANEEIALSIANRVEEAFDINCCQIPGFATINLQMNFGTATFYNDGETAQELLQAALLRKQQEKLPPERRVSYFPQAVK